MKQTKIDNFMAKLHSRAEIDSSVMRDELNLFLSEQYSDIVHYMNNAFFINEKSIFSFIKSSINQGSKADDDLRKLVYQFLSEYIVQNVNKLNDYVAFIFKIMHGFFANEHAAKPKQFALLPLITIIDVFDVKVLLSEKVLNPDDFHNNLVNLLKCQKFTSVVKGQIWLLISTIQGKFTSLVNADRKRQVQSMCLYDLRSLINENKNFSTIAAILKSFEKSLEEVFLTDDEMKELYRFLSVLILPLNPRYQVPINALQLLQKKSNVFHVHIMQNGNKLFTDLCGLTKYTNRQFMLELNDTLDSITKQIVKGIQQNPLGYDKLYHSIISKSWSMLQQLSNYQVVGTQTPKEKFRYNIVTILKILGTLSPLVKQFQTPAQLQKFFNHILNKCSKKITKAFEVVNSFSRDQNDQDQDENLFGRNKMHIKFILYNQKQLVSFILALSQIIYNVESLTEYEENELVRIILIAIQEYPNFLQKYVPDLMKVLVEIFKVLQIKCSSSHYHIFKKIISSGFKILLDSKKYNVDNDDEYYAMIRKATKLWNDLINDENWSGSSLTFFGGILFQFFETMIEHLDISYKSSLQVQIQQNAEMFQEESAMGQKNKNPREQRENIAKIFYLSAETVRMSNIEEFQYMHSLVLVFEGILSHLNNFDYSFRIIEFYKKMVQRIRVFPKSVSLMKVIRALNNYLVSLSTNSAESKVQKSGSNEDMNEHQGLRKIQEQQLNQYCLIAKKLYVETIDHYLQRHQEECLYECLKMLTSFPVEVYFYENCQIFKMNLSYIIKRCFQMGQQIISLADSAINCVKRLFEANRSIAEKYLIEVIPKMQRFIWISDNEHEQIELESSKKIFLFLDQMKVTKETVAKKIMDFLGSIGGLVHLLVDNSKSNSITWDYQDPLEINVLMGTFKCTFNLSKLLNRTCFLALNGERNIKNAACQFLHSVFTIVIGNAAEYKSSKQVTANFLDKVFPTVLEIASNSSHPSQQLIHTILIQSIRFFALTQEPNSPDISAILKHLLQLYNGTEDMSCLGSKCIAQLVRWHIKSDVKSKAEQKNYPIIKVIMRNIWTLASNKKAKDGLILLLVQLLRQIHREQDLMKHYALEICSIIINIGRSNEPIEKEFNYLIDKLVLSLSKVIKKLIIEDKRQGDQYKKYPTINKFLESIYETNFFSIYSQQREIAFILWKQIINKYSHILNVTCLDFLRMKADRTKLYLFSKISRPLEKFSEKEFLPKIMSKLVAVTDIWRKMLEFGVNSAQNLARFKDIQEIVIQSYVNFNKFLVLEFSTLDSQMRCFSEENQKIFIQSLKSFPHLLYSFKNKNRSTADWLQQRFYYLMIHKGEQKLQHHIQLILKMVIKPSTVIPNFNYDLLEDHLYLKTQMNIKNKISLHDRKDVFQTEEQDTSFTHVMIDYMFYVCEHKQDPIDLLKQFFTAIQKLYYVNQTKLIRHLFSRQDASDANSYPFSSSFVERHENSQKNSYVYQREIKTILRFLLTARKHYRPDHPTFTRVIQEMIGILKNQDQFLANDKREIIVSTILGFQEYDIVRNFFLDSISLDDGLYRKFQKVFNAFLLKNFSLFSSDLFIIMRKQPKVLKLFYFLKAKLPEEELAVLNRLWTAKVPQVLVTDNSHESDYYRLNYFFAQTAHKIQNQREYLQYLNHLIKQGLNIQKSSQVQFLAINLASILLRRLKQSLKLSNYTNHEIKNTFDRCLSSVSNFYIPFTLGQLKKEDQIINAQRYLRVVQNMIFLIDDFKYCAHLFVGFKDTELKGKLKRVYDSVIESIVSKFYGQKQAEEQEPFVEWVLSYYQNQEYNNKNNPWNNFRLAIIEKFFVKLIHFTKKTVLIKLFEKYTQSLMNLITEKVSPKNAEDMIVQFQIKQGAFIILQHLYMYLPKPQKDKALQKIHTQEYHKKIIAKTVEILKSKFDNASMTIMNNFDKNNDRKSLDVFRNYMCSAYNCLIVIFISTQSKVDHFKKYLFEKGEVLWQHLVDPIKVNYNFPIQTEFQLMKPIQALSKFQFKNQKNLQKKIRDQYMQSSLYVIHEQAFPQSLKENQVEASQVEQDDNDIKEGSIEKVLKLEIEEDYINRHPCMINLLRVIDYMQKEFYDGTTPSWMKPIFDELISNDIPLSVRILLTKVILNRPEIFTQSSMWGQCLMKYLCLKENGGSYIHYFYRDALLLLIKYIKNGFQPKVSEINFILMKLIRCLPHDKNMMIYSSNIDIMEEFMKLVPEVFVEKSVIIRMFRNTAAKKGPENNENAPDKNKFQWKMCACIVMKSCLIFKIPILEENEWRAGKANNKHEKFGFFTQFVRQKVIVQIQDLIKDNSKKYRIAASGLLGEMMRFFNQNNSLYSIPEEDKQLLMHYVRDLINRIYSKQQNRGSKQRLSLLLSNIISRYPMVLSDMKLFGILDTVIVKYKQDDRFKILEAVLIYLNELVGKQEKIYGYSVELMHTIRTAIGKFIVDSLEVYRITIKIIKTYAKPFFLQHKEIFLALFSIFDTLEKHYADSEDEAICMDYFEYIFSLKDFLTSVDEDSLKLKFSIQQQLVSDLRTKIKQTLIKGLGNKFNSVRKTILEHFEASNSHTQNFQQKIIQILKQIYSGKYENLWIMNTIPLIFSMAKKSSNYNSFLFNKQIQQSVQFYDVDFKNISFQNTSQPYTPSYSFFTNNLEKPQKGPNNSQQNSFISSLGSNRLGGMIRATQNSYMSQEEQVFTILGSQSQSIEESLESQMQSGSQMIQIQNEEEKQKRISEERNYSNLNNIFMNNRKRTFLKQVKQPANPVKFESNVNLVGDKIRFKPKEKQGEARNLFKHRKRTPSTQQSKNNKKIHSTYRSYKIGQMPNVQITLGYVLEPLVEICCFDKEIASEFFTIFLNEVVSKDKKLVKCFTEWFVQLLKNSRIYDFSFISTLQKCLITICEQGNELIQLNMNDIAIKSNTIDYAIVFTEENLIKYKQSIQQKEKLNILIQDEGQQRFIKTQWSDLIDLYQQISGHAFLPPMLKHITRESEYDRLLKTLNFKESGAISDCYKQLEELMRTTENTRLHDFLQKQKIDCLALLGEWDPVTDQLEKKMSQRLISNQQKRLLTLSLLNSQKANKEDILQKIKFPEEKFDYQKALIALMNYNTDLADYHSDKEISHFYKFFKKTTSFDYNSKHILLENIQKVYEMKEFLAIYKNKEPMTVDILNGMNRWAKRLPNEMYDSNMTWIEILESRILFTSMLNNRFSIPKQKVAKANTDYMIQVVNQMLKKNIYGCAEVITKKALSQMKISQIFNWAFYESLSDLKLFQFKKKVVINPKSYEIVPKIILKELTQSKKTDFYSDIKYLSIENDHLEGYLQSCAKVMSCEGKLNIQEMSERINKIYMNYDRIKKSFKNLKKQAQLQKFELQKMECKIHFSFSLFLENILELTKGKLQIKQIADLMEKSNLPIYRITENFALELIETISMMNMNSYHSKQTGEIDKKQKNNAAKSFVSHDKEKELNEHRVFSMILKLLKMIQRQKSKIGQIFSEAINDRKLPIWIFVYFIPQIIKTLNSHQLVEYFADLFDSIMKMYPESLVYHFNCYYEKEFECITEPARQIYKELHQKLKINFDFIDALELLYHPEKRLKQILEGFTRQGEEQNTIEELERFITIDEEMLGKYNKKFIEQHKQYIRKIINLKREKKSENVAQAEIQKLVRMLDPKSKEGGHQIRDFTKISDGSLFFENYNSSDWNRIEVPATIYCKFEEPLSWNRIFIESFDLSILTLKSQRKPKRITLYGSNQKKYMFLVKGGEDVRLDQRIEELFNIVNKIFKNDPECAKKKLQIKRFEVIPIKKMLGIFEWIDDSQTLKQVLQKELRKIHENYNFADMNPAFKQYTDKVRSSSRGNARQNSALYREFLCLPEEQIVANLKNCQSYLPFGLLRKTLLRLSKSYDFYLHIKNEFLSNYAVACIVGYILGIGDRHLQNFLIHGSSASVILIDFGYSFGSSRDLAVPELIPFRLTKCFTQIMEPIGYQGIFKQAMVNAFSAMQDNKNIIIDFCDVFIDDPLMEWIWKCKKEIPSVSLGGDNISMTISQEPPEKKIYSKRIEYVQKKLVGEHPRRILMEELYDSKHRQAKFFDEFKKAIWKSSKTEVSRRKGLLEANEIADELITLASDKNILGRCYIGLNPFV